MRILPLGSESEHRVAIESNQGSWISIMSNDTSSDWRRPCMRPLLRWMLTDLILTGCSDISRGGFSVSGVREDESVSSQRAG